jgi:hypothetical protein
MNSEEITVAEQKDEIRTIDFFGIKISLNAYIILIAGLIMCIILIFVAPYGPLVASISFLLVIAAAYNVNCVQVGHCKIWAWVLTIAYIIFCIVNVMTMYATKKGKNMINAASSSSKKSSSSKSSKQ